MTKRRKNKTNRKRHKPLGAVIAIGNQKGGVGKSTVTVNLAAALGELGHKVLVIDLDPSGGATHHLGVDPYAYEGAVELLNQQADPIELAITEEMPENVGLIAARPELSDVGTDRVYRLRAGVIQARKAFDFILLDTPPNPKSLNTFAAYATADWFLFVTTPHALSVRGLSEAWRDVDTVRQKANTNIEILGTIFNAVDTRSLALRDTKAFLAKHKNLRPFGAKGFIPWSVLPNRAAEQGTTLFQNRRYRYKPITLRFEQIAAAITDRCINRKQFLASSAVPKQSKRKKRRA